MSNESFDRWLEFEHWESQDADDPEDDSFNMQITLSCGRKYALNVWTDKSIRGMLEECNETGECLFGSYLVPPDLFVQRLDRSLVESVVADLIAHDGLKTEWTVFEDDEF